jgi:periplasmic protein TonB
MVAFKRFSGSNVMAQASISVRQLTLGAAAALALVIGGSSTASADSPAKIDHSYPTPQPAYPDSAQLNGEQGDVTLDVYVNSAGTPRRFKIFQSSGFGDLDNAAAEAVAGWHFIPAIKNGNTGSAWTAVKIHFALPQPVQAAPASAAAPAH